MKYIGSKKIKDQLVDKATKEVILTMDDDTNFRMHQELFEIVGTDKKAEGEVTDVVRAHLAKEVLAKLAYYGLDYNMAVHVAQGIQTLVHNLREEAIQKKFGVDSSNSIKIDDVI